METTKGEMKCELFAMEVILYKNYFNIIGHNILDDIRRNTIKIKKNCKNMFMETEY